ncbi:hypothetical protein [Altibacter sp. HG106]|uniref:hypothetical protein n=1 Tax=Altibacter sp. HG106 TaxID=3023937 RepID=UPI002351026D|nr:hypothetical protein [Altibacter sp. HG106]MDC7993549.1 hypothetical protein [Altibacter sp. HG106]
MKQLIIAITLLILGACNAQEVPITSSHISETIIDTPQVFLPGIVSMDESTQFDLVFAPDNKTIYFTRRKGEEKQRIYYATYSEEKGWSTPEITSFSTDRDEYPNLTPDGSTLYFGSERAIEGRPNLGNFDTNVWMTKKSDEGWSSPSPLSPTINYVQAEGEQWPVSNENHFHTVDGETFYLCTQRPGTEGIDLYQTTKTESGFSEPQPLAATINTEKYWEYAPKLSPDGNYLFFQSYGRPDTQGGDDIYVSKRGADGQWQQAQPLGAMINTGQNECPTGMTWDGNFFFFTRDEPSPEGDYGGISKVYFISMEALMLDQLFEQ